MPRRTAPDLTATTWTEVLMPGKMIFSLRRRLSTSMQRFPSHGKSWRHTAKRLRAAESPPHHEGRSAPDTPLSVALLWPLQEARRTGLLNRRTQGHPGRGHTAKGSSDGKGKGIGNGALRCWEAVAEASLPRGSIIRAKATIIGTETQCHTVDK